MRYRITFSGKSSSKSFDITADSVEQAFSFAYQLPEAKMQWYFTDVSVQEIPAGPSVIGIKFQYTDTYAKQEFIEYLMILADSESQAVKYYNKHYKGGRFWFNASENDPTGKNIRGQVLETYYSSACGYDADATKEV